MTEVPLKHLVRINAKSLPEETDPGLKIRYIDIGSVGTGALVDEPKSMTFAEAPSRARRLVEAGDTIVSTVRTYLRAVWPVRESGQGLVVSTGFAVLTPGPDLDARYLGWTAQSDPFVEAIVARSVGVSYPAINASEIGELRIHVPAPERQRAIADYLGTETARIDALVAKKRRLARLLAERVQGVVDEAVTVGDEVPLRRIISRLTSGPRGWAEYVSNAGETPFLRIANVSRDSIELDRRDLVRVHAPRNAEAVRTAVRENDVLVSITADIGSVGIARKSEVGAAVSQHVALITPSGCEPEWLAYSIRSSFAKSQLEAGQYGGTKTQLGLGDIASLRIRLPEPTEQSRRLAALRLNVGALMSAQSRLGKQIELLREHRQALVTAAVTGELEIPGVS
jgi:type I restriction enzyme, S subunit